MTIAGIDGCKGGWLCIEELNDGLRAFIASNIIDAVDRLPAGTLIGIDIPIGLPNDDSRHCDVEARWLLGARGVCVFPAPLRVTLENTTDATSYEEAERIQRPQHARDKGISQQAWRILPKIRDVDVFLRADVKRAEQIIEVHPEVCFAQWNGGTPTSHNKKSAQGRAARAALIDDIWPMQRERLLDELKQTGRGRFQADDLYDAFVALWTMRRYKEGRSRTLPATPERDAANLPMQIIV
jgi:predicted RNase H-like nuclease